VIVQGIVGVVVEGDHAAHAGVVVVVVVVDGVHTGVVGAVVVDHPQAVSDSPPKYIRSIRQKVLGIHILAT